MADAEVKFWLDEDGGHVVFQHHCAHRESWKPVVDEDGSVYPWNPVKATLPLSAEWWVVQNLDPLTVTPSVLCSDCGCHGFITNGVWVSC